jgi:hypothetical protein
MSATLPTPRTVCAWCGKVIRDGEHDAYTSHGICPDCEAKHFPDIAVTPAPALREQCQCCMYHRWGSCPGLTTDAKEYCEDWEPMPSRDETFAGLAFIAAVLGMAAIVLYCLFT